MTRPFIIWCNQRTGSIALFNALSKVSEFHAAESEPFDPWAGETRQFANTARSFERESLFGYGHADLEHSLAIICRDKWLIKHVYDRLPLEFNLSLARLSTKSGYRHIRLKRADESARLLSLGIAEQAHLWFRTGVTEQSIQDFLAGKRNLDPLPVDDLMRRSREANEQWRRIGDALPMVLNVESESLFGAGRRATLLRLFRFLGLDTGRLGEAEAMLRESGQNTARLAHLVPNVGELRGAML